MRAHAIAIVGTVSMLGCHTATPSAVSDGDTVLRTKIARLEAARGTGTDLIALAHAGPTHQRELALRGLGRIGGDAARAELIADLKDRDPAIVDAAAAAIGILGSLDDTAVPELATLARRSPAVIEAIGRAGDPTSIAILEAAFANPELREHAAIAMGRFGRRKIAIAATTRAELVRATTDLSIRVRFAATWAIAREFEPKPDQAILAALDARLGDADPEVRAMAASAFERRKIDPSPALIAALTDPDPRVSVEAVRALAKERRDAIAAALPKLEMGVAIEALRVLVTAPRDDAAVTEAIAKLDIQHDGVIHQWIACLRDERRIRVEAKTIDHACLLPETFATPMIAELVAIKEIPIAERHRAFAALFAHEDARVRAVAVAAWPALWDEADPHEQELMVSVVVSTMAAPESFVVGAALEAAGAIFEKVPNRKLLTDAVLGRASGSNPPDLESDLLGWFGEHAVTDGLAVCTLAANSDQPLRVAAGRDCLTKLKAELPARPTAWASVATDDVDVASVIGKRVQWHLKTTRGDLVIELKPDVAPWAVATIAKLTRAKFYDNVAFHRVVHDFVVQGGDRTETGSGGPGFSIPAEPASLLDGGGFVRGGIGIADSGRDSGGSQWFAMHVRAPHLDGRYTWVGQLTDGQKSADSLEIADRVLSATVEITNH